MDSETGLYYLRARYYDPNIGRFISEDSYWGEDENPLSLNLYTYCHNDPINFTDPTGHSELKGKPRRGAEPIVRKKPDTTEINVIGADGKVTKVQTGDAIKVISGDGKISDVTLTNDTPIITSSGSTTIGGFTKVNLEPKQLTLEEKYEVLLNGIGLNCSDGITANGKKYTYMDLLLKKPDIKIDIDNRSEFDPYVKLLQGIYKKMGFDGFPTGKKSGIYDNWATIEATRSLMALYGLGWEEGNGGQTSSIIGKTWDKIILSTLEQFSKLDSTGKVELQKLLNTMQERQHKKAATWEKTIKDREMAASIKKQNAAREASSKKNSSSLPPWGYYGEPPAGWFSSQGTGNSSLEDFGIMPYEQAKEYMYSCWGLFTKSYSSSEIESIPKSISYMVDGKVNVYSLTESTQSFNGISIPNSTFELKDGTVISTARYSYEYAGKYNVSTINGNTVLMPELEDEISYGIVPFVPSGSVLGKGTSETPKIYNANGDVALRVTRRPAFDSWVSDGIEVNGQTFKMNQHAENSLFKSGRKDIMPDDIIDAIATKPQPAQAGSVQYVNPNTGTTVFVNPTTNEIVGVWPSGFGK